MKTVTPSLPLNMNKKMISVKESWRPTISSGRRTLNNISFTNEIRDAIPSAEHEQEDDLGQRIVETNHLLWLENIEQYLIHQ